jgi:catechol 2,3-dioxygenase-like lactoylglutathione lyase family enzyme
MIDHISLRVQDYPRAKAFYAVALAPLGYQAVMEFPGTVGMGVDGKPDFWISQSDETSHPTHIAFTCQRAQVDAFHAAALQAGGTDNGPPGLRPDYHPNYYAAFVLDPEGNNIETVCHAPPEANMAAAKSAAKKPANRPAKPPAKPPEKKAAAKPIKKAAKAVARKPIKKPAKKPMKKPAKTSARRR